MDNILSFARLKAKYKLNASFAGTEVLFSTDRESESYMVYKYLNPLWNVTIEESCSVLNHDNVQNKWTIVAATHPNYASIFSGFSFYFKDGLLYDNSGAFVYQMENGYTLILHKGKFYGLTIFCPNQKSIYFIRDEEYINTIADKYFDNMHIIQLIKEPISVLSKFHEFFGIHCSACNYNGKGILAAAGKGSGKSTFLMHMLSIGAKYIGNDIAYLNLRNRNTLEMHSYPHFIRLGEETVKDNRILTKYFFDDTLCLKENPPAFYIGNNIKENGKLQFVISDLKRIFNSDVKTKSEVDIIIFPKLCLEAKHCNLSPVDSDQALENLEYAVFKRDLKISWLPLKSVDELEALDRRNSYEAMKYIPRTYEFTFGDAGTYPAEYLVDALKL